MSTKRYMNDKGEIRDHGFCLGIACCECPNDRSNNGFDESCNKYMDRDSVKWYKNLGWREIFELENYTDRYCMMICDNDEESEVFARFLETNGKTWHDGRSYIKWPKWKLSDGTGFLFNQGWQMEKDELKDTDGHDLIRLNFKDYVFKMGDKKVKKDLRKLIKSGYMLEDTEGTRYLATEYLDDGGVIRIGLVEDDKSVNYLTIYDTDLRYKGASVTDYDIVKIWGLARDPGYIDDVFTFVDEQHRDVIWTREEPVKEMTVAEIEKELGYSIKVVK